MIITRAPYRVSFLGGGSDLESFYSRFPGAVLSTTITKYTYIASHHFFDQQQIRVKYSKTETKTSVDQIEHPIVREVLRQFHIEGAIEISSNGDVVAGSGLGSSSAFTVAMLLNMYARTGQFVGKKRLAEEACDVEIRRLGEPVGRQDQYASAYGGLNLIRFDTSGVTTIEPVPLSRDISQALQQNLLMFHTGLPRSTATILAEQSKNMEDTAKFDRVRRMVDLVWEAREALCRGNLHTFGELLDCGWHLKREVASKITNELTDQLYQRGRDAGAIGGKLLGAGGSGFLLFYCEPQHQTRLRAALAPCRELAFKFDVDGAKVIFTSDED